MQDVQKIINLTPHTLVFFDEENMQHDSADKEPILMLPSEGIARANFVAEKTSTVQFSGLNLNVYTNTYNSPVGIPDAKPGVILVVSVLTAQAVKHYMPEREDIFVVNGTVRNSKGAIIGCTSLARV